MPGMPSSDTDLWPDSWRREPDPRYRRSAWAVGTFLVVVPLVFAAILLGRGDITGTRYMIAVAGIGALILAIGVESRLRLRHDGARPIATTQEDGRHGLKVPYSRRLHLLIAAMMSAIALVFLMAALDSAGNGGAYVWGALTVVFTSFPLLLLRGKYALGYLHITPDGILHRGWTFRAFLPWSGVDMFHPMQTDGPDILITAQHGTPWEREQLTRLWRADKPAELSSDGRDPTPAIQIPGKYLAADPALVLAVLVFYGTHPESRSELGTEAALHRVRSAAFDA